MSPMSQTLYENLGHSSYQTHVLDIPYFTDLKMES